LVLAIALNRRQRPPPPLIAFLGLLLLALLVPLLPLKPLLLTPFLGVIELKGGPVSALGWFNAFIPVLDFS
jgi:hypothetical protein